MSASKPHSDKAKDENLDPISGEPGAHPVGTGLGAAAAGAATGAAGGLVAGPVGAAVGAVIGAVAGGLGGKAIAESIDPTVEDAYWEENYTSRPYANKSVAYDHYRPALPAGMGGPVAPHGQILGRDRVRAGEPVADQQG